MRIVGMDDKGRGKWALKYDAVSKAEDDTFHLIEITRKTGNRKGFWGE